jgi:hypothetical protein
MHTDSTSYPVWFSFHSRAIPPWLWLAAFDASTLYPDARRMWRSSVNFVFVNTASPTPICTNPLAADVNPALRPQWMFHAASVKAPLPPGKESANEIDTVVGKFQLN